MLSDPAVAAQISTYTAACPWARVRVAAPLADLRAAITLAQPWFTPTFVFLNKTTLGWLRANTNTADLGGRTHDDLNALLRSLGLPPVLLYDAGYLRPIAVPTKLARLGHWLHLRPLYREADCERAPFIPDGQAVCYSTEARAVILHV